MIRIVICVVVYGQASQLYLDVSGAIHNMPAVVPEGFSTGRFAKPLALQLARVVKDAGCTAVVEVHVVLRTVRGSSSFR